MCIEVCGRGRGNGLLSGYSTPCPYCPEPVCSSLLASPEVWSRSASPQASQGPWAAPFLPFADVKKNSITWEVDTMGVLPLVLHGRYSHSSLLSSFFSPRGRAFMQYKEKRNPSHASLTCLWKLFWSTSTSGGPLGAEVYSMPGYVEALGLAVDEHLQIARIVGLAILHLSVLGVRTIRSGRPVRIMLVHQAVDMQSGEPLLLELFWLYRGHHGYGGPSEGSYSCFRSGAQHDGIHCIGPGAGLDALPHALFWMRGDASFFDLYYSYGTSTSFAVHDDVIWIDPKRENSNAQ